MKILKNIHWPAVTVIGTLIICALLGFLLSPEPAIPQPKYYTTDMPWVTWTTIKVSGEEFLIVSGGGDIEIIAVRGR